MPRILAILHSMAAVLLTCALAMGDDAPARVDFDRDIRPILSNTCYACHGPDEKKREADLRLDTNEGAFAEIDGHRVIVPGKLTESELYRRITSRDKDERMPPPDAKPQLTRTQIELLKLWIEQGATWSKHWSFVAPRRHELPKVNDNQWPANGIDFFILARLEREGLEPSALASKEMLIRRVTLDLTGLPPTIEEVDEFLADSSRSAYERVVDRLLKSSRYGEHMALAWLDVARYADSNGYQGERTRTMWPWRDWVIRALNDNMPYDQFTIEQLAGDLLPNATVDQRVATGFNRNHMLNGEGGRIAEESRVEYVVDRVDTTATTWLGLTAGCARCHDHKYDPITQKEFYRLFAYFNNVAESGSVDAGGNAKPVMKVPTNAQNEKRQNLNTKLTNLKEKLKALGSGDPEAKRIQSEIDATNKSIAQLDKSIVSTMVMQERPTPRNTFLLNRGQWDKPDKSAELFTGVPISLAPLPADAPANRLGLARWLVDPANPLTARVTVNRQWQQFFGVGLVKTTEDFGTQGERPSHTQLLDWLANELVRSGWDMKQLHKLFVMSATYRQSSKSIPAILQRDPTNRLLARGPRFRLTSQAIRDQALALSGLLVEKIGGPPVRPYQPAGVWLDLTLGKIKYEQDHGDNLYRRSIYTFWRRSVGPTMLFDTSARQVCTVRASRTNTPLHALTLMNDTTFVEAARVFAERIIKHGGKSPADRLALAFRMATARHPSQAERETLVQVFQTVRQKYVTDRDAASKLAAVGERPRDESLDVVELAAYASVTNMILNLDEVITKE